MLYIVSFYKRKTFEKERMLYIANLLLKETMYNIPLLKMHLALQFGCLLTGSPKLECICSPSLLGKAGMGNC